MIKKFGKFFDNFESNTLMIALSVMVIVIFTNVVMRYIFNSGLTWSEELARYLFIWFSWLGVSAGVKDGAHLRVEMLSTALTKRGLFKADEILTIIVSLIWLATTAVVAYYGFMILIAQAELHVVTPAIKMPVWFGYLSVAFCSALVGIRLIINIFDNFKKLFGKADAGNEVAN